MYPSYQRKIKRIVAFLLVAIVTCSCFVGCKKTKEDPNNYVTLGASTNLQYQLNADSKTYAVVGIDGDCTKTIVIPPYYNGKKVTRIAESAFEGQTHLNNITIPETVVEIGARAFYGCTELGDIELWTFPTNKKYAKILTKWEKGELMYETVSPEEAKSYQTFYSDYVSNYPDYTFIYENGSFFYPTAVYADYSANKFTGLSLSTIGDQAFYGCSKLLAVHLPDTVTSLGAGAFSNCSRLHAIGLSKQIGEIKESTFAGCNQLFFVENNSALPIRLGATDHGEIAKNALVVRSADRVNTYSQENYTLTEDGFLFAKEGDRIVLRALLSTQPTLTEKNIQSYSYKNIVSVSSFQIVDGIQISSISDNRSAFAVSSLSAYLPDTYNGTPYTLHHFFGATTVVIPMSFTEINDEAFANSKLLSIIQIENPLLQRIGKNAFQNSSIQQIQQTHYDSSDYEHLFTEAIVVDIVNIKEHLTLLNNPKISLSIPKSVQEIDAGAFAGCDQFSTVRLGAGVSFIGKNAFSNCQKLEKIETCYTDGWERNGAPVNLSAFDAFGNLLLADPSAEWRNTVSKITYTERADTEEGIHKDQYKDQYAVTGIGACTDSVVKVVSTYYGKPVTAINECRSTTMTEIHIPSTIQQINRSAFYDCPSLQTIVFQGTKEEWSEFGRLNFDHPISVHCTDGTLTVE